MLSQLQFIFTAALDFFLMLFKDTIFVRPNYPGIQWHLKFHEWRLNWSTAPIYQVLWFCWHFIFVFSSMDCLHFLEPTDREYFITNKCYNTVYEDKNQRTMKPTSSYFSRPHKIRSTLLVKLAFTNLTVVKICSFIKHE